MGREEESLFSDPEPQFRLKMRGRAKQRAKTVHGKDKTKEMKDRLYFSRIGESIQTVGTRGVM